MCPCPNSPSHVGKYTSTMEHMGMVITMIYHCKGNHDLSSTTILRETMFFFYHDFSEAAGHFMDTARSKQVIAKGKP